MTRVHLAATALLAGLLVAVVPAYERIFDGPAWRSPVAVAVVVAVTLAGVVLRLRGGALVAGVVNVAGFVAVVPWLVGAAERPLAPGPTALGVLTELWTLAGTEIAQTPSPAPALPGIMLVVLLGFWTVAYVGHELLARWRQPGLAVVAATVLWAGALAVPVDGGQAWARAVPFLAAAALTLLLGPRERDELATAPRPGLAAVTIAAVAIGLGVGAPQLLPGHDAEAWIGLGGGGDPRGYQPIVDVSERLRLPEERDVLRVRSSERTYLRLAGLDSFDGFTWRLGDGDGSFRPAPETLFSARDLLPPEQPAAATQPVFVDVEVLELENIYVPVPYQPVEVLGPQRDEMVWSTEGGFLATWDTVDGELAGQARIGIREGVTYRVQAARPTPAYDDLLDVDVPPEVAERWTRLPRAYPALREQAEEVYAAAGAVTMIDRALALQDWFVEDGGFEYDLDVPALRGDDALEAFVLEDRTGYCEYFATAMAVMLRETGIPARVAVGFLPGRVTQEAAPEQGRDLTEFTVSTADAHAWVEVLFPGHGWVTFEPTPRSDETQVVPTADDLAPIENVRERRERERAERLDELELDPSAGDAEVPDVDAPLPSEDLDAPDAGGTEDGVSTGVGSGAGGVGPGQAAAGAGVLALGAGALLLVRRRREEAMPGVGDRPDLRVLRAQRQVFAAAARYGVARRPEETTVEVMARWRREQRVDARADDFARVAQAAAFGGAVDAELAAATERTAQELAQMLRASVEPRDRALAPVRLPLDAIGRRARTVAAGVARRGEADRAH